MNPLLIKELNGEIQSITGSLFVRESTSAQELPKGKKMMIVMGVILVDETFPFEGEMMMQIAGYTGPQHAELVLVNGKKMEGLDAFSADRIFCQPIWRA